MKRLSPLAAGLLIALAVPAFAASRSQSAVFSGGCFWSMQHDLEHVPGVVDTVVGYAGGTQPHPTYDEVSSERTGYLESIKVTFDPAKISYAQLVQRYWHVIDPTDAGGAFCDRGNSYHSAIFVSSPEQKRIAEESKAELEKGPLKGRIVTPIRDATTFWPAEDYHQHYSDKNPEAYNDYRTGCRKDAVLRQIWGPLALK